MLERGSSRAERPGRRAFVERFSPIRPPPRNVHVAAAAVPRPSTDYPRGTRGGAATLRGALSILRGVVGRRLPRGRDAIAPRPRSAGTTGDPGPRRGVADCPGGRFEPPDTVRRRWAQFPPRRRRGRSQRSPTPPSGARGGGAAPGARSLYSRSQRRSCAADISGFSRTFLPHFSCAALTSAVVRPAAERSTSSRTGSSPEPMVAVWARTVCPRASLCAGDRRRFTPLGFRSREGRSVVSVGDQ